jgi:hypothetical protein
MSMTAAKKIFENRTGFKNKTGIAPHRNFSENNFSWHQIM